MVADGHHFSLSLPTLFLLRTSIDLILFRFRIKTETRSLCKRTYVGSTIFILYPPFLLWCGVVTRRVYQLSFYFILLYHGQTLLHINQSFLFVHTNIQIVLPSYPRMHTITKTPFLACIPSRIMMSSNERKYEYMVIPVLYSTVYVCFAFYRIDTVMRNRKQNVPVKATAKHQTALR